MEPKKIVGVVTLAVAAAIGLYYLLQPVPVEQEAKPQPKRAASPPKPQERKVVELPPEPQVRTASLTLSEYIACIKKINNLLVQRLKSLKQTFNQNRRASQSNPEEYSKLVKNYKTSERSVWESVCSEVIQQENLPNDLYEAAHNEFMNKMEVVSEKENLKKALTYGVVPEGITEEKVREILEFEIKLLTDAHSVEDHIQNAETIARIEDRVFETFAIEIEDLRAASQVHQDKVKPLIRQILRNYSRFKV